MKDSIKMNLNLDTKQAQSDMENLKKVVKEVNEELEKALVNLGLLKETDVNINIKIKDDAPQWAKDEYKEYIQALERGYVEEGEEE